MRRKECELLPFRGFGTESMLRASGRLLERRPPRNDARGIIARLRALRDRFETDEIAGATIRIATPRGDVDAVTDDEGHFQVKLGLPEPLAGGPWHALPVHLVSDPTVRANVDVIIPTAARHGIISDIDDTIVSTNAYHPIKKLKRTFLTDARGRVPFPGVPELYRALVSPSLQNPIFYVSSSPWNLHEVFCEAFEIYGVPRGPMFFKDFGLAPGKFIKTSHDEHKLRWIGDVMSTYPSLPFILFGDNGQRDALIYAEIARRFPRRVAAVYLREVTKRSKAVTEGLQELTSMDIPTCPFRDTSEAAAHAEKLGFTTEAAG